MHPDQLPPALQVVIARVVKAERRRADKRAERARRDVLAVLGEAVVKSLGGQQAIVGTAPAGMWQEVSGYAHADPVSVLLKAAAHAPAGGVTVGGKEYVGGQFIPSEVMAEATPEEKAAVAGKGGAKAGKKEMTPERAAKYRRLATELRGQSDAAAAELDSALDRLAEHYPAEAEAAKGLVAEGRVPEFLLNELLLRHVAGGTIDLTDPRAAAANDAHGKMTRSSNRREAAEAAEADADRAERAANPERVAAERAAREEAKAGKVKERDAAKAAAKTARDSARRLLDAADRLDAVDADAEEVGELADALRSVSGRVTTDEAEGVRSAAVRLLSKFRGVAGYEDAVAVAQDAGREAVKFLKVTAPPDRLTREAKSLGLSVQLADLMEGVRRGVPADVWAYEDLLAAVGDEFDLERIEKADRSHLVRKVIQNRLGRRQVVWVKPSDGDKGKAVGEDGKAEEKAPKTREQVIESRSLIAAAVSDPNRLNPEQVRALADHIDAITKDEAKGLLRQLGQKVGGDQMAVAQRLVDAIRSGRGAGGVGEALKRAGNKTTGQYGAWGVAAGGGEKPASRDEFPKRGVGPGEGKETLNNNPAEKQGEVAGDTAPKVANANEPPRDADKYSASQLESGLWVTPHTRGTYSTRRDAETAARAALNDYAPRKPRQPKPENPRAEELRADINAAAAEQRDAGKVAKQATDLTQAEFLQKQGALYGGGDRAKAAHRRMVEGTLSRGGIVPPEVLADYPDLAAKAGEDTPTTPDAPFTGTDAQGREWRDGEMVAKVEDAKPTPKTREQLTGLPKDPKRLTIDQRDAALAEMGYTGVRQVGGDSGSPDDAGVVVATGPDGKEVELNDSQVKTLLYGESALPVAERMSMDDLNTAFKRAGRGRLLGPAKTGANGKPVSWRVRDADGREAVLSDDEVRQAVVDAGHARRGGKAKEKTGSGRTEAQSPTTGVDNPTTGGNTTPVQPQFAGASTGGGGMTPESEIAALPHISDSDRASYARRYAAAKAPVINLSDAPQLAAAIHDVAGGLPPMVGDDDWRTSRTAGDTHKVLYADLYDALKDRLPPGTTLDDFKRHMHANRAAHDFDVSRVDLPQTLAGDRFERYSRSAIADWRGESHGIAIPVAAMRPKQSAGANTGGGGMQATTELKPLVGVSDKQVSFAAEKRGKVIGEAEKRLGHMLEDLTADTADGASEARIQSAQSRIADMRAGIEYLKTRAVSAAAWLDHGRNYYGHTLALALGAWINRQDKAAIDPYRAFVGMNAKAEGGAK